MSVQAALWLPVPGCRHLDAADRLERAPRHALHCGAKVGLAADAPGICCPLPHSTLHLGRSSTLARHLQELPTFLCQYSSGHSFPWTCQIIFGGRALRLRESME